MSNTAATVRSALKSELGLTSKRVSVCTSSSGSVRVTIKEKLVSKKSVEAIAQRSERFQRDEATGEVLSGGNTFVFVDYAHQLFADEMSEIGAKLEAMADGATLHMVGANVIRLGGSYTVVGEGQSIHCNYADCAARMACEMRNEHRAYSRE